MDTVLTRTGDPSAPLSRATFSGAERPSPRESLAAVAQRVAERVTSPHRDLPPEWFRFPLP